MSDFFQSELVRGDIQEMTALQEFCFRCAMNLSLLDKERKLEYFEALEKLIEKQKIFHARICLSDDPEAKSCLLYTSPSPRDVEESRMPSSA